MAEQDPTLISDETGPHSESPRPQAGRPVPALVLAAALLIGLVWWGGSVFLGQGAPNPEQQEMAAPLALDMEVEARAQPLQEAVTPTPRLPEPTATAPPVTQAAESVPLPTVTATPLPSEVPSRTLTFAGTATLRLQLQNDAFASSGKPLELALEPRTYTFGNGTSTVTDRWCMQMGLVNLVFDLTFDMNPINGAIRTSGALDLYDGFCETPGPQRISTALDVEVPADASAQVHHSLQTETHMLEVDDLLNIDTGVFVELVISNTRR